MNLPKRCRCRRGGGIRGCKRVRMEGSFRAHSADKTLIPNLRATLEQDTRLAPVTAGLQATSPLPPHLHHRSPLDVCPRRRSPPRGVGLRPPPHSGARRVLGGDTACCRACDGSGTAALPRGACGGHGQAVAKSDSLTPHAAETRYPRSTDPVRGDREVQCLFGRTFLSVEYSSRSQPVWLRCLWVSCVDVKVLSS